MSDFGKRLKDVARKVRCELCEERDEQYRFITCVECSAHFHKQCVQPLRAQWPEGERFVCDECAEKCVICHGDSESDENPLIICDNCEDLFHLQCIEDPEDRPPADEIGDEETEWLCAECYDEYASDNEWAEEHIVPTSEMTADECFTRSECTCNVCAEANAAVDGWKDWKPTNPIQQSMKAAIDEKEGLVNQVMDELHFTHNKPPAKN